jgi:hypothetical protein
MKFKANTYICNNNQPNFLTQPCEIMKNTIICLLTCVTFAVTAQVPFDPTQQINQFTTRLATPSGTMPIFDLGYDNIKGSPFVIDEYCSGTVWMTKNRTFTDGYQYKYDETKNTVQAKNLKTGLELELLKEEVIALKLDYKGRFIMFVTMEIPKSLTNEKCLMQIIYHSPNYCLVKRPIKSLERVKGETLTQQESYSIYKANPEYFLRNKDKFYEKIKLTKKAFKSELEDKATTLEKLFEQADYKGSLTDYKAAKVLESIDTQ